MRYGTDIGLACKRRGCAAARRGYTLVELMVASVVSSVVVIGLMGLTVTVGRIHKNVSSEQRSLRNAKSAIEGPHGLNREIRLAQAPLELTVPTVTGWGNGVRFSYFDETEVRQILLKPGPDGDIATPWDNVLVYQPTADDASGEVVIAQWLAPLDPAKGAFSYTDATTPLIVQMRAGDPLGDASPAHTGPHLQGAEVNITVSPRN